MNGKQWAGLLMAGAALTVGGWFAVAQSGSPAEAFYAACDKTLMERLKAPSTYKRLSATEITLRDADLDTFMRRNTPEARAQQDELARANPDYAKTLKRLEDVFRASDYQEAVTIIEYEAANSYGTPLRDRAICSDYIPRGQPIEVDRFSGPRINNATHLEWTVDQVGVLAGQ